MSGQAVVLVLALTVGVPVFARALIRDCERAERRAWERRVRASSPFAQIAANFEELSRQLGEALLPTVQAMTEAFAGMVEQLRPIAAWGNAEDVSAWRRPVVRLWRRHGWRWPR